MTMIGDDDEDDLVIMMAMSLTMIAINGDVDNEDRPISSAGPVVNKILYLQREHLEATAAATSFPAAV